MLVKQLIDELKKCPQGASVRFFVTWDDRRPVGEISPEDADGDVLLGESLPAECYARDYKDD